MKRILSFLLAVILLLGLCACEMASKVPQIAEEDLSKYEAYAMAAAKYGKYSSTEVINRVLVRVGDDTADYITKLTGGLEITDLSEAGAVVVIYTNLGERILVMNHSVADGTNTELKEVLYAVGSDRISFAYGGGSLVADAVDTAAQPGEVTIDLHALELDDEDSDSIRWRLAQLELDYEEYCKREDVAKVLLDYEAPIAAIRASGEDITLNEDWLALQAENTIIAQCAIYERKIGRISRHLVKMEAYEAAAPDSDLVEFYVEEQRLSEMVNAKLSEAIARRTLAYYAETGEQEYQAIAPEMEALKTEKGENYRLTTEYFLLRRAVKGNQTADPVFYKYEAAQWQVWLQERYTAIVEVRHTTELDYELRRAEKTYERETEYISEYREIAIRFANAAAEYEAFLTENWQAYSAYTTAAEAIIAKYNDNGYEKDMDYIKLQIQYEDLLEGVAKHLQKVSDIEAELAKAAQKYEDDLAKIQSEYESTLNNIKATRDRGKITEVATKLASDMKADEQYVLPEAKNEEITFCLQIEGEVTSEWVEATKAYTAKLESASSTYVKQSTGGGSSGGKICAKSGCTKKAVTSGDSIYCATHSNRCGSCGCYIDGDAMYCMSCIRSALGK